MAGALTAERVEDGDAEASGALDFDLVQVAGELGGQAARRARAIRPAAQAVPDRAALAPIANPRLLIMPPLLARPYPRRRGRRGPDLAAAIIAVTENGCAVRCVTRSDQAAA
jgi:hypothetical protein